MLQISLLVLAAAAADSAAGSSEKEFGAVMAPAILPRGTTALYGILGAPTVAFGYRQGFEKVEFETRESFNWFQVAGTVELGARAPLMQQAGNPLILSMGAYLGGTYDSGNSYLEKTNYRYFGLNVRGNVLGSYRIHDLVYLLGRVDLPLGVAVTVSGISFAPTAGIGGELRLGNSLTLLLFGSLGAEVRREPLGILYVRPAWSVEFAVGWRVF